MNNKLKTISLTSYALIIFTGEMIRLPFILWIAFTGFDFENSDQFFAFSGLIGLITNFTKYRNLITGKIFSFILMILPIVKRLIEVPAEKFNYLTFQMPFLIFVITYLIYIIKPSRNKKTGESYP